MLSVCELKGELYFEAESELSGWVHFCNYALILTQHFLVARAEQKQLLKQLFLTAEEKGLLITMPAPGESQSFMFCSPVEDMCKTSAQPLSYTPAKKVTLRDLLVYILFI